MPYAARADGASSTAEEAWNELVWNRRARLCRRPARLALNPLRRLSRASLWLAAAAGVLGAAAAKMAGNVAGLFYDGETLEWPVCTAAALLAVAVTVGLSARR